MEAARHRAVAEPGASSPPQRHRHRWRNNESSNSRSEALWRLMMIVFRGMFVTFGRRSLIGREYVAMTTRSVMRSGLGDLYE